MSHKLFYLLIFLFFATFLFSQRGKNSVGNVSVVNTRVNEFTPLSTNAPSGSTFINVGLSSLNITSRFSTVLVPGDLIMIIQMQGALIKLSPVPIWAPDSTYGGIYDYNTCGNYEFAEVKSVPSGTQIELACGLSKSYSAIGKTQIVRVPRYSALNISTPGTLTTDAWNGSIGGILAIEVQGNTIINSGASMLASGLGFRGGVAIGNSGSGNQNFVTKNPNDGAEKGEGIGSDRLINSAATNDTLGKQCKGAPANGGGGGNANNCGGGGGANGGNTNIYYGLGVPNLTFSTAFNLEFAGRASVVSSGGGKGGYGTSTVNGNPNTNPPNNPFWGSFERPKYGGFGGRPLDYTTGKIFMGGGGGAGHKSASQSNGLNSGSGGAGGGLIFIVNYGTISGGGTIVSNGINGTNSFGTPTLGNPTQGIDGAGGAGSGGTIILKCNGTISGIAATANGGTGGNQVISGTTSSEGQGPGGGGSGGYIAGNGSVFAKNITGGTNGTTNATAFVTAFPMNGATSGDVGTNSQTVPTYSLTNAVSSVTLCTNQSATLTAGTNDPGASVEWYNNLTGGVSVATGTVYATPVYTLAGTYTVYAASCPGTYRQPITITVNSGIIISINSPTICAGQSTVLTPTSSATSYTWSTGAVTNTISVSPAGTTIYTVTGFNGSCSGIKIATVTIGSGFVIAVSPSNSTICPTQSAILTASGANTYTWNTGPQTSTLSVTPSSTTVYTVVGSVGTCTGTGTSTVTISAAPVITLTATSANICSGQSTVLQASGANTYTWSNAVNGSSQTVSPVVTTTYSINGTNLVGCTNPSLFTITINVTATPSISSSSATICIGSTATLTAIGAASYTWSTGETTAVINPSPTVNTTYTVSGSNGGCSVDFETTVTVTSSPLIGATASLSSACGSVCVSFSDFSNSSTNVISYNFGDGNIINGANPTHCYSNSGSYTVVANALDPVTQCAASFTLPSAITINNNPVATFTISGGNIETVGTPISLVNSSVNANNFLWVACQGTFVTTDINIVPADTGRCCIKLTAYSNAGCKDSVTKCIIIIDQVLITIPNVFTPNNDSKNDIFKIKSSGVKTLSCSIFDRWGLKIYEWDGINGFWDGKAKTGTLSSDGSYFYIINYTDFKDASKTEKGFLSLFHD